jgi:hypothetical protein
MAQLTRWPIYQATHIKNTTVGPSSRSSDPIQLRQLGPAMQWPQQKKRWTVEGGQVTGPGQCFRATHQRVVSTCRLSKVHNTPTTAAVQWPAVLLTHCTR